MRKFSEFRQAKKSAGLLLFLITLCIFGAVPAVFAHGGEDHGDGKPKTTADVKGQISRTARLGDFEVMVKHTVIEPDTATPGRLFITNFQTNAPADKITPAAEIESGSGAVTPLTVEQTDSTGSFNFVIPALPAGTYTLRTKVTYAGETDTATFSGVQIETAHSQDEAGISSWLRPVLLFLFGAIILSLFGALLYSALRNAGGEQIREKAVSI